MTLDEFRATLGDSSPPTELSAALIALWHDGRGEWDRAHGVAQEIHDTTGAWVHAYLHRREGDLGNAQYWYRRAGQAPASDSLDDEWATIAEALLRT